jgi:hypothetical protein
VVGVAYLPWIPSLLHQMRVVSHGDYYFHGLSNPIAGIGQLLTLNFTKYLPFKIIPSVIVLAFLLVLGLSGLLQILKHKNGRIFIGSLITYVAANFILDLILKTNTICVRKLMFFLSPVSVIFLAAGCRFLKDRFQWKFSPFPILAGLIVIHLFFALPYNLSIDGPYGRPLLKEIDREISSSAQKLAIINQPRRRYVFSFAHAMTSPPDFVFTSGMSYRDRLASIAHLREFDCVVMICFCEEDDTLASNQLEEAGQLLKEEGFVFTAEHPCVMGSIVILKKAADAEQTQDGPVGTVSLHSNNLIHICNCEQN